MSAFSRFLYGWLDGICTACDHPAGEHTPDGCQHDGCGCRCWMTFTPR